MTMATTMPARPHAEYRAFMLLETVPANCILFEVTNDDSLPHLRFGEQVIVDTSDTEPRNGEIYVIQWNGGSRVICQANAYGPGQLFYEEGVETWRVGSIRKGPTREALKVEMAQAAARGGIYVSPGWCETPFDREYLQSKLVGRVVGIFQPMPEGRRRDVSPNRDAT